MQRIKCYTIDVAKLKGSGDIKCPKCGITMSPDDETEEAYTVLEVVTKGDDLNSAILKCTKCQTQICLTGFHLLNKPTSP